jgi:hypothetical protein
VPDQHIQKATNTSIRHGIMIGNLVKSGRLHNPANDKLRERYLNIRQEAARCPTSPAECKSNTIQLPEPATEYSYYTDGSDMTKGHASISVFNRSPDGMNGVRGEVSATAARLDQMVANPIVRQHFLNIGYAVEWMPNSNIISPPVFQACYKAEISEQAVRALLLAYGDDLSSLEGAEFERFDGRLNSGCLVDVKHYSAGTSSSVNPEILLGKTARKLDILGDDICVLVNLFPVEENQTEDGIVWTMIEGKRVGTLSGLLNPDGSIRKDNLTSLINAGE